MTKPATPRRMRNESEPSSELADQYFIREDQAASKPYESDILWYSQVRNLGPRVAKFRHFGVTAAICLPLRYCARETPQKKPRFPTCQPAPSSAKLVDSRS